MEAQKVITVLLPEGEPNGLKIVQLAGWVGEVLIVPRGKIGKLLERQETQYPGIYFLFGEGEDPNKPLAYIGQSGNVCNRIKTQAGDKDYWNTAVVFVGGLEGGDVKYLEQRCFEIAKLSGRCEIRNNQNPEGSKLSEFKQISTDQYLENIQFLLSAFGFPIFQTVPKKSKGDIFYCVGENMDAKGALMESGEFIVYKDSIARQKERPALHNYTRVLRKQLESEGSLKKLDEDKMIFTRDYIFKSPSAASEVIKATPSNGWTSWVSEGGKTLSEAKRGE